MLAIHEGDVMKSAMGYALLAITMGLKLASNHALAQTPGVSIRAAIQLRIGTGSLPKATLPSDGCRRISNDTTSSFAVGDRGEPPKISLVFANGANLGCSDKGRSNVATNVLATHTRLP
jgi:hypothetical protein